MSELVKERQLLPEVWDMKQVSIHVLDREVGEEVDDDVGKIPIRIRNLWE